MVKLICLVLSYGFYLAIVIVCLKHRHFTRLIVGKTYEYMTTETARTYRCVKAIISPVYKPHYFGYDGFILPEFEYIALLPADKLRVYGIVSLDTECIILVKQGVVKTVVVLRNTDRDVKSRDVIMEDLQEFYKIIIIISAIGGVILWQVNFWFSVLPIEQLIRWLIPS